MFGATCSLLTRVCAAEMPYLEAFLRHHQKMGIDLVDIILQDPKLLPAIDRMARDLDLRLISHLVSGNGSPAAMILKAKINKERDYVLLLDPDEFLFFPGHANLASFLAANESPKSCYLRWVLSPCDFSDDDRCRGYFGHVGKHLAASKFVARIASEHTFSLRRMPAIDPLQFERHDGLIIHYWGRTFRDTLLKCLYYRGVHKSKQSSVQNVKSCQQGSSLPSRLKLLAALNLHTRYVTTPDHLKDDIDLALEEELLKVHLNTQDIRRVENAYCEYKDYLAHSCGSAPMTAIHGYPGRHSIQTLAAMLPAMPSV